MANLFELAVEVRNQHGKGAMRRLRRDNKVPAIIYGTHKDPEALMIDHHTISRALSNESFYSRILTLDVSGNKVRAVLKDVQRHPYRPQILHVDFLRISETEKITMKIPLHFKGEKDAPGVKESKGIVFRAFTDVEIRCLPAHLPEFIEVDISRMKLNESLHLSDLRVSEGVEIVALAHGNDHSIVSIHIPKEEVEPEVVAPAAAEGEAAAAGTEATAEKAPEEKAAADKGAKGGKEKE